MILTTEQKQRFDEQGYLVFEGLLSDEQVRDACAGISHLITNRLVDLDIEPALRGQTDGKTGLEFELCVRKLMWFCQHEPRLAQIAESPQLKGVIEGLLGEPATMAQEMALLKPPHLGREKPWHQDTAYFRVKPPEKVIGSWIALDEATVENGCMQIIPGSHKVGPIGHDHPGNECELPVDQLDADKLVPVPLKPGGALIFSGLLHHGTPPNRSPHRRRALQYHYMAQSCEPMNADEHGKMFARADGSSGACLGIQPRESATNA